MKNAAQPLEAENQFFTALIQVDIKTLEHLLTDDFVLVDVMRGGEIPKTALLMIVGSGQLKFESVEKAEMRVRTYQNTAVATGRTLMKCSFEGNTFTVKSRYTHVYIYEQDRWRMASAQGTQIADA
jgi:ketosteroid isomerase-like protein